MTTAHSFVRGSLKKYSPTVILCLIVWVTVIVVRTHPANPLTAERIFAIVIAAGAWFIIGTLIERIRHNRQDRN